MFSELDDTIGEFDELPAFGIGQNDDTSEIVCIGFRGKSRAGTTLAEAQRGVLSWQSETIPCVPS